MRRRIRINVVTELFAQSKPSSLSQLSLASLRKVHDIGIPLNATPATRFFCWAKLRPLIRCQPLDLVVWDLHINLSQPTNPAIRRETAKMLLARGIVPVVALPRPGASEVLHPNRRPQPLCWITTTDVAEITSQGRGDVARPINRLIAKETLQALVNVPRRLQLSMDFPFILQLPKPILADHRQHRPTSEVVLVFASVRFTGTMRLPAAKDEVSPLLPVGQRSVRDEVTQEY